MGFVSGPKTGNRMEKDLNISFLMDFYAAFLTENQREILEMYYDLDYSLSEIAEAQGITRQGVLDVIKRGEARLKSMEEELSLMKKYVAVGEYLKKCEGIALRLKEKTQDEEADELLGSLRAAMRVWEDKDGV